jgi:hypothetical protein
VGHVVLEGRRLRLGHRGVADDDGLGTGAGQPHITERDEGR